MPKFGFGVKKPDLSLPKADLSFPEVDLDLKAPELRLPKADIIAPEVGLRSPTVDADFKSVEISLPSFELKGKIPVVGLPEVALKETPNVLFLSDQQFSATQQFNMSIQARQIKVDLATLPKMSTVMVR